MKTNTERFHLGEVLRAVKFMETESKTVVARGCGEGRKGSCCLIRTEFQFYKVERGIEVNVGDDRTTL